VYEGIDVAEALYEWNYPRQLLSIRLAEAGGSTLREEDLFAGRLSDPPSVAPGARASRSPTGGAADRRDRPRRRRFRAFLLELLGEASVTIPEIGTIRATHRP